MKRPNSPIDRLINVAFQQFGSGAQIPVMDLSKISAAGRAAYLTTAHATGTRTPEALDEALTAVTDAVKAAIARYRVN